MASLGSVDIAFLLVIFFSVLIGLYRGFIREIISLFSWITAFIVAALFSSRVAGALSGTSQAAASSLAQNSGVNASHAISIVYIGIAFIAIFLVTLLIGSFVARMVSQMAEGQGVSLANRFLGALFGLVRGLLVVLMTIFLAQLTPFGTQPAWAASQFAKAYDPAVKYLDELIQPGLSSLKAKMGDSLKNVNPSDYIDQLKKNYQDTGASQFFQK